MKWEFTIHSLFPLTFTAELSIIDAKKLENYLAAGQNFAVTTKPVPYEPEPEAPWPIGPTLEDM